MVVDKNKMLPGTVLCICSVRKIIKKAFCRGAMISMIVRRRLCHLAPWSTVYRI